MCRLRIAGEQLADFGACVGDAPHVDDGRKQLTSCELTHDAHRLDRVLRAHHEVFVEPVPEDALLDPHLADRCSDSFGHELSPGSGTVADLRALTRARPRTVAGGGGSSWSGKPWTSPTVHTSRIPLPARGEKRRRRPRFPALVELRQRSSSCWALRPGSNSSWSPQLQKGVAGADTSCGATNPRRRAEALTCCEQVWPSPTAHGGRIACSSSASSARWLRRSPVRPPWGKAPRHVRCSRRTMSARSSSIRRPARPEPLEPRSPVWATRSASFPRPHFSGATRWTPT